MSAKPKHVKPFLRELLRCFSDGLTTREMAPLCGRPASTARFALANMPDVYIDRWVKVEGRWQAVWCAVVPPDNCPHPTRKDKK